MHNRQQKLIQLLGQADKLTRDSTRISLEVDPDLQQQVDGLT